MRAWPDSEKPLSYIYYGQNDTWITLSRSNVIQTVTLKTAIEKNYVAIQSGGTSIQIVPKTKTVKLIKLKTNGFAVGEQDEIFDFSESIKNIIPANPQSNDWRKHQKKLHEAIVKDYITYDKNKVAEYATNKVKNMFGKYERSKFWEVSTENKTIRIKENKIPANESKAAPFDYLINSLYADELEEMSVCINLDPSDSSLSASITGMYKGILPVSIEYNSENKFIVSTELADDEMKVGAHSKIDFSIEYAVELPQKKEKETCNIEFSGAICFPLQTSTITAKVCNTELTFSPGKIKLGF
jgi:hypothetical protein